MQCNIVALNCHLKKKVSLNNFFLCTVPEVPTGSAVTPHSQCHSTCFISLSLFSFFYTSVKVYRSVVELYVFECLRSQLDQQFGSLSLPLSILSLPVVKSVFCLFIFLSNSMSLYGSILVTYFFSCLRPQLDQRFGSLILLPSMLS